MDADHSMMYLSSFVVFAIAVAGLVMAVLGYLKAKNNEDELKHLEVSVSAIEHVKPAGGTPGHKKDEIRTSNLKQKVPTQSTLPVTVKLALGPNQQNAKSTIAQGYLKKNGKSKPMNMISSDSNSVTLSAWEAPKPAYIVNTFLDASKIDRFIQVKQIGNNPAIFGVNAANDLVLIQAKDAIGSLWYNPETVVPINARQEGSPYNVHITANQVIVVYVDNAGTGVKACFAAVGANINTFTPLDTPIIGEDLTLACSAIEFFEYESKVGFALNTTATNINLYQFAANPLTAEILTNSLEAVLTTTGDIQHIQVNTVKDSDTTDFHALVVAAKTASGELLLKRADAGAEGKFANHTFPTAATHVVSTLPLADVETAIDAELLMIKQNELLKVVWRSNSDGAAKAYRSIVAKDVYGHELAANTVVIQAPTDTILGDTANGFGKRVSFSASPDTKKFAAIAPPDNHSGSSFLTVHNGSSASTSLYGLGAHNTASNRTVQAIGYASNGDLMIVFVDLITNSLYFDRLEDDMEAFEAEVVITTVHEL